MASFPLYVLIALPLQSYKLLLEILTLQQVLNLPAIGSGAGEFNFVRLFEIATAAQ